MNNFGEFLYKLVLLNCGLNKNTSTLLFFASMEREVANWEINALVDP
jgi:hypothetical protein